MTGGRAGADGAPRGTLLAVGDSITNEDGCWAALLASSLGLAFERVARDGLTAPVLVDELLDRVGDGPYDVGALWIGVNDVRDPGWDALRYERALRTVVDRLAAVCARLVMVTAPLDLGRPRAGAKVADLNAIVAAHAVRVDARVVDVADMAGPAWFAPDAVHLTPDGQAEVARRAQAALAGDAAPAPRASGSNSFTPTERIRPADAGDAAVAAAPPSSPPPSGARARARARWAALRTRGRVTVAPGAVVGRGVAWDVAPGARVTLGAGAALGDRCRLHVAAGATVAIGEGAVLGDRCVLRVRAAVTIEDGARIGDETALVDHGPVADDVERPLRAQGVDARPIAVGERARIGPGAVLGPGATVAAGDCVSARIAV